MKIQRYTAITDNYPISIRSTDILKVHKAEHRFKRPVMDAKIYKILGHKFHPDADILIWMDANITSTLTNEELVSKYLPNNSDFAIPVHPYRNCIYDEFRELKTTVRFESIRTNLGLQENHYKKTCYPVQNGLYECNFIIRKNSDEVNTFFENWWSEICRWTYRDQVSLPFLLEHSFYDLGFNAIKMPNIRNNPDFTYVNHYI